MEIAKRHKFYPTNRQARSRRLSRLLLVDILPTLLLLLAMALAMAYVAHKTADLPQDSDRATVSAGSAITG